LVCTGSLLIDYLFAYVNVAGEQFHLRLEERGMEVVAEEEVMECRTLEQLPVVDWERVGQQSSSY
jgi:hypothetical protein